LVISNEIQILNYNFTQIDFKIFKIFHKTIFQESTLILSLMQATAPSLRYPWYVVSILMVAYISSFIDRQVLALLVEPIKRDFGISDTQMGLLIGFSFAIFYTFLGLPIGWLADRRSRKWIIVIGITIWSIMTALCGLANTYWILFFFRMGVGVGEAALSPAAYSIITDYFPKNKLGTALGFYNMGVYLGSGLSILLVALIIKLVSVSGLWDLPIVGLVRPWQTVFFMVGLPGLLIVATIAATVREPIRKGTGLAVASGSDIRKYFRDNRQAILSLNVGIALMATASYGATSWTTSSLIRLYGMTISQAGLLFGGLVTVFSTLGVITGGRYADFLSKKGVVDAKMRVPVQGMVASTIVALAMLLTLSVYGKPPLGFIIGLISLFCFTSSLPYGAATAALQEIIPANMRGTFSAFYLFVINLIGLGCGPLLVGFINDRFFGTPQTIMLAMSISLFVSSCLSALVLYRGLSAFAVTAQALDKSA
jgi:MFS family permease